jgi:hypothetical protein
MALVVAEGGGDAGTPDRDPEASARRSTGPAPKP